MTSSQDGLPREVFLFLVGDVCGELGGAAELSGLEKTVGGV